jgi:serine phosphatase RsbU (regulator of sigma subunit)/anti-sigma regulatory factor (Ser/Thr protein kinase)
MEIPSSGFRSKRHAIHTPRLGSAHILNYRSSNAGVLSSAAIFMKRFFQPRSIGQRFALAIGAGAGAILIALAVANFLSGRDLLLELASKEALNEVHEEIGNWDDLVERIAMIPRVIGATELAKKSGREVTVPWLASLLSHSPGKAVYGLYMVREGKDWRDPESDIWVDRKSWPQAAHLKYDFHGVDQDWYRGAKEKGKGIHVTLPYFDEGGSDIEMISITKAVHDASGKFIGVAGADVSMEEMKKSVRQMHLRDVSRDFFGHEETPSAFQPQHVGPEEEKQAAYLISGTGAVIVGPSNRPGTHAPKPGEKDPEKILGSLADHGLQLTPEHLRDILSRDSGWLRVGEHGDKVIYWARSRTTNWKLLLSVPYSLIIAPARDFAAESILIDIAGLLLLLGVVFYASNRVAEPIRDLEKVTTDFRRGSFEKGGEILSHIRRRRDELGKFAAGFSEMAGEIRLREERLSQWNANLEQTVSERTAALESAMDKVERANRMMSAELAQAATYSRAVLPARIDGVVRTDWVFETSTQLGGDSFGYHWIDEDHLAIYLLDVCGHGVGAAFLATSVANTLRTESLVETDFHDPAMVLRKLNELFPMEQHNEMYFTAWYGVYSRTAGALRFACGGHPPPLLITLEGSATPLRAKGPVVGAFPHASYENSTAAIPSGSRLYLFSDGVYEIDRPGRAMMTYEEFTALILESRSSDTEAILEKIRAEHGGELLEDDFSLVSFEFVGGDQPPGDTLIVRNTPSALAQLHGFVREAPSTRQLNPDDLHDLEVILEELVTNILKYGSLEKGAEACRIDLVIEKKTLRITICDQAIPFDPLAHETVDTGKPIEERPIGGLGIHFVKNLTATQHYEYRDGRNILTLTKELRS